MHMRHHIMSPLLFFLGGDLKLLPVKMLHKIPHVKRSRIRNPGFTREDG